MARKSLCVLMLLPVWLAVGCASGESVIRPGFDFSAIDKVAVVEVTGAIGSEAAKNAIADYFAMELMRRGYIPVERHQVQAILKEQDFQASDLTSNEGAAAAGRLDGVVAEDDDAESEKDDDARIVRFSLLRGKLSTMSLILCA